MPILHTQYTGKGQAPDGTIVDLAPAVALLQGGPWVNVLIGIPQSIAHQLTVQGAPVPLPVSGRALIDTGASSTCIDDTVAQQLQLPVIDVVTMASASHAADQRNVYPAVIEFIGFPMRIDVPRAVGAALSTQGIIALLGRDLLQHCTLHY